VPEQLPPASGRWSDSWHKIKAISGFLMPSLWWMLRRQDGNKIYIYMCVCVCVCVCVSKLIHILNRGKSILITGSTSTIFRKLSKVHNRPVGENSPNLVTLQEGCLRVSIFYHLCQLQLKHCPLLRGHDCPKRWK
jgi:hypothetical protein